VSRTFLSGNEAVARGAWEAGVAVGVGYPGTPSTEALEHLATLPEVRAEWAVNEKVALEVGAGVSLAGARSLVTMKHVGLNVAADPLFTLAYTGVRGGLVVLVADDPGMHSSQNEQDSHNYAAFARVVMLDPSDSQEALDYTRDAFSMSEAFDIPVLVRSTVRVSHAKSLVTTGERHSTTLLEPYQSDPAKWVMMPGMARLRRLDLDLRMAELEALADDTVLNREEMRDHSIGIVCSGPVYQHVREAMPQASTFKLGMTFPLPATRLREFAKRVEKVYVVEEADSYLKRSLCSLGIATEPLALPGAGELSPGLIRRAFGLDEPKTRRLSVELPPRPPGLCAGCPHRPVFYALRKVKAVVTGDIGCYTLGASKPLGAMDTCVDMGASVGMAHGAELGGGFEGRPVVAVIGDSTFAHSGITGLVNTVYNGGSGTVAILDNRTTAMTGRQGNPINGIALQDGSVHEVDLPGLAKALGAGRVRTVDAQNVEACVEALVEEVATDELSVIIFRAPCALLEKSSARPFAVDASLCAKCRVCTKLGCPAISVDEDTASASIDAEACVGCGQCVQVCRYGAIVPSGLSCDATGADV
jgi:indolepyruvate ferredoxin oxidoreductase, alpha subunit